MPKKKKPIYAIIPVKMFVAAKSRLETLLSETERKQLCQSMLEDVLQTLNAMKEIQGLVVVSNDQTIREIAKKYEANYLKETKSDLNHAISEAIDWCLRRTVRSVLIIPSDIPLIQPDDFKGMFNFNNEKSMVIVPSKEGSGTNALLLTPPTVIPTFFGLNSFYEHLMKASTLKVKSYIYRSSNIEFDIDTETDLKYFFSKKSKTKTYTKLIQLKKHICKC
jgi:2-phospho-L-lactate guanylyltransferase